jgi:hypothetical protein
MTTYRLLSALSAKTMNKLVAKAADDGWELYLGLVVGYPILYQWVAKEPEEQQDELEKLLFRPRKPKE